MLIKKKILIFIPAYNVENHIFDTFNLIPFKILNKLANISFLLINVNSNDKTQLEINRILNTYKKLKIYLINNKKNLGYGGVQKLAFNYSIKKKFNFCIMLHGDGQYHPRFLPKFIKLLIKYSFYNLTNIKKMFVAGIFGSRMINWRDAIKGGMPLYKFIGNKILTFIQNILLFTNFSEFHSGYRSYNVNALKNINFSNLTNEFHFDTEIILEFLKKKFLIMEFPIKTHYGKEVSHLKSIPYGFSILKITFGFFFRNARNKIFKKN